MEPSSRSGAGPDYALVAACAAVAASVAYFSYLNRYYALDDALIYYRYVRNCLMGNGLVYNVGERFNALTSPLHTYLALVVCGLFRSIQIPMVVLSGVLTAATACGLAALFAPHEPRKPFVALGALLIAVSRYVYSVYGMETALFLLLIVVCLGLFERGRTFELGIAGGLLVLARGEGVLLLAVLAVAHLMMRRPGPRVRDLVAPVLIVAANATFNTAYYGSPMPHTLMAKVQQGRSGLWGGRWLLLHASGQIEYFAGSRLVVGVSVALAILGVVRLGKRPLNVIVLAFLAALTLFYLGLNVPNYHWYYAPYYAFGTMYAAIGLASVFDAAARLKVPAAAPAFRALAVLLGAALLLAHAHATQAHPVSDDQRQRTYPQVGMWLERNTPADASVAMVEVGIIGYYSNRRVVDILGLVTPHNAESLGEGHLGEWLERGRPDFIVVHVPLWPHEDGVAPAVRDGRYRVSDAFHIPGFELLERTGHE